MSHQFRAVQWNRHKKIYDAVLAGVTIVSLVGFVGVSLALDLSDPAVAMLRATGTLAIVLLHVILCIGPLARLDARFNALLYNRRHLGVTMATLSGLHTFLVFGYYGGFGNVDPVTAVLGPPLAMPAGAFDLAGGVLVLPYEWFGLIGLVIILAMGVTSHDFWLAILGARFWKSMHMLVYVAYAALVAHVAVGLVQRDPSTTVLYGGMLAAGVIAVSGLHVAAALKGRRAEQPVDDTAWLDVGAVADIPEDRAMVACPEGRERVAIFRHNGEVSAVTNVCKHQGGPLGEGKVVDGCLTCPWHGYQYTWGNGQSPPPYTEKIATYEVRVEGGRVLLNPEPNAPGTPVPPVRVDGEGGAS